MFIIAYFIYLVFLFVGLNIQNIAATLLLAQFAAHLNRLYKKMLPATHK